MTSGTATVSYILGTGCYTTTTLTINTLPSSITGPTGVCIGATNCLTNATTGGSWTISPPGIATIVPTTGCFTGAASGTATVTYKITSTGCYATIPVTVSATPTSILGTLKVCVGSTVLLSNATPGGAWSSSNTHAGINPTTGLTTGLSAGTTTISYTIGGSCAATAVMIVNPLPGPILGPTSYCTLGVATLSDALGGGTWSASNTVVTLSGSVLTAGSVPGVDTITYKITSTGCLVTATVSVGMGGSILGSASLCTSTTTTLSNTTGGGIWSSSNTSIATVGSSSGIVSGVSAGTANITYSITGCGSSHVTVTVSPVPSAISGPTGVCVSSSVTLSDAVTGGNWSSSNTAVATIGLSSGIVAGLSAGSADITYSFGPACSEVYTTVTVSPLPAGISGSGNVCTGNSITLSDATSGGVWSSSNTTVATVTITGDVYGVTTGTSEISYTLGTGCLVSVVVTVDPSPSVSASLSLPCGSTVTLTAAGATTYSWSPTTDLSCSTCAVTTLSPSVTTTYTVTGTDMGCSGTAILTVNGDRIYGHITFAATTPDTLDMKVWLIQYNPADSSIAALDSTLTCTIDSVGYYEFDGKATGNYLVKSSNALWKSCRW